MTDFRLFKVTPILSNIPHALSITSNSYRYSQWLLARNCPLLVPGVASAGVSYGMDGTSKAPQAFCCLDSALLCSVYKYEAVVVVYLI